MWAARYYCVVELPPYSQKLQKIQFVSKFKIVIYCAPMQRKKENSLLTHDNGGNNGSNLHSYWSVSHQSGFKRKRLLLIIGTKKRGLNWYCFNYLKSLLEKDTHGRIFRKKTRPICPLIIFLVAKVHVHKR